MEADENTPNTEEILRTEIQNEEQPTLREWIKPTFERMTLKEASGTGLNFGIDGLTSDATTS